ncbi:hypothetical protein GCM10009624_28260 [Gordonia sinesedis]
MLDSAVDRVMADGIGAGLEHIRLEDAVRDADVSRTGAYRCWSNRDDFLADLLAALAEHALPIRSTRSARATEVIRDAVGRDTTELRTSAGRRAALRRAVLASANDDLLADRDERERWRLYLTLAMATPTLDGAAHDHVATAVARAENAVLDRLANNYRRMFELFGFGSRVPFRELAGIGLALMRGYVIGDHAGSGVSGPGDAYALLVDAAATPEGPDDWDEARARTLLDDLARIDAFNIDTFDTV